MNPAVLELFSIPGHTFIAGRTKSGKTYLCRYLLKNLWFAGKFSHGAIISMTSLMSGDWACIPTKYHVNPKDAKRYIESLMNYQSSLRQYGHRKNAFLIIDDAIGAINWRDPFYLQFLATARQYDISVFVLLQYLTPVPPQIRAQADNFFYMRMASERELQNAYNQSFSLNFSFPEFKRFLALHTEGSFKAIYHHNASTSNNPEKIYRLLQAPENEIPFMMSF